MIAYCAVDDVCQLADTGIGGIQDRVLTAQPRWIYVYQKTRAAIH